MLKQSNFFFSMDMYVTFFLYDSVYRQKTVDLRIYFILVPSTVGTDS